MISELIVGILTASFYFYVVYIGYYHDEYDGPPE